MKRKTLTDFWFRSTKSGNPEKLVNKPTLKVFKIGVYII